MSKAKSTDELPDQVQEVVYCLNIGSLLSEKYGSRSVTDIQQAIRKQFADNLKARIMVIAPLPTNAAISISEVSTQQVIEAIDQTLNQQII